MVGNPSFLHAAGPLGLPAARSDFLEADVTRENKTTDAVCGCDGYFDDGCPACTPVKVVPFPGTRAEREAWWRGTFVVGQPHPFDVAPAGEPLTQAWVNETVTALLDSEDAANAR